MVVISWFMNQQASLGGPILRRSRHGFDTLHHPGSFGCCRQTTLEPLRPFGWLDVGSFEKNIDKWRSVAGISNALIKWWICGCSIAMFNYRRVTIFVLFYVWELDVSDMVRYIIYYLNTFDFEVDPRIWFLRLMKNGWWRGKCHPESVDRQDSSSRSDFRNDGILPDGAKDEFQEIG